ncbi:MAG: hypothetical protein KJZ84_17050 [Bryobacteraceae bacterium]|nr:hypothetical protein [Bryobacteraceae bacterium]
MTSLTAIKDAVPRLTLGYGYPAGQNNGNLASQSIADATGSWQQTYTYDNFNRLTHAAEAGSWSETSSYDRWGNRWVSASSFPLNLATPTAATQFDTETNRLQQESNGQPLPPGAYDAQGNLTNHPWIGQMSYSGVGKIWRHIKGGTTVEFTYDGEGRRVKKRVGTAPPTYYVYDAAGQLAADYGTPDGTLNCSTCYITADHLGSTRLTTGATGAPAGRLDYFPFGETIPGGASFGNRPSPTGPRLKFTGKERDAETGLDYFIARYYSAPQGRFTTPDIPLIDQRVNDPQSWNLYAYGRNNPLKNVDPTGNVVETIWDIANVAMDVVSLGKNVAAGNWAGAAVDAGGLLVDVAATFLPGVPGGAGTAIKAARAADVVVDAARGLNKADTVADVVRAADNATDLSKVGRSSKQEKLLQIAGDQKAASSDRGWIRQEQNSIDRGQRTTIRNPPGKDLAHERGREAAKGYRYKHSKLQNRADHQRQHRYDDYGRRNKERPLKEGEQ